jgi:hypothetical protein
MNIAFKHDPRCRYTFRDPTTAKMAQIARDLGAMMAGGFVQYSEQALLNGIWGNCCGKVRTTITAASTAQTAIATGSFATGGASGNMDQTPNGTATIWTGTPGSGSTQNQYTAPHAFLLTASSATSLTIASQSIGLAVTAGDCIFTQGSSSAGGATTNAGPMWAINTYYIGLSTQTTSGATQSNLLSGEPTSTGSYARIVVPNTQANFPNASAASPSVLTCGGPFSFAASTAAWSSGATNLATMFFADASTLGGGNIIAWGPLGTAQAVNASGITLSFASSAITITLT